MPSGRKKPSAPSVQKQDVAIVAPTANVNAETPGNTETNTLTDFVATTAVTTAATATDTPVAKPAKKQKKQFSVVASIGPDGIKGSLQQPPDLKKPPLIAHLPIHSKDIIFQDQPNAYNPIPPQSVEPFDETSMNPFCDGIQEVQQQVSLVEKSEAQKCENISQPPPQQTIDFYKGKILLVEYKNSSEIREIPKTVTSACFWCCHTFTWQPVILPYRDMGEYLQVCGNYCSPQCACAYLFSQKQDSHLRWEQLSLLHRLYGEFYGQIIPAPSRTVLQLFGGPMSIDEFRNVIFKTKQRIDVHMPPMISLLETMDTKPIDFYDTTLTKTVMETVHERLAKAEESLKLKRTKPLRAWESTLDAYINIKVRGGGTQASLRGAQAPLALPAA